MCALLFIPINHLISAVGNGVVYFCNSLGRLIGNFALQARNTHVAPLLSNMHL